MQAKYEKIAAQLRRDLDGGRYCDRMPSERELARLHATTIMTMRRAQSLLIDEGRLIKRQPHGTFIIRRPRRQLNISFHTTLLTPGMRDAINACFHSAFPDVDLCLLDRNHSGVDIRDCDLIGVPNLSPLTYQDIAVPFKIESSLHAYFEPAFEVHRIGRGYYGLPVLFSPTVLMGDHAFLESVGVDGDPGCMNLSVLVGLADEARQRGFALWDRLAAQRLLRSLVFAAAARPGVLHSVPPERFEALMLQWGPLFAPALIADQPSTGGPIDGVVFSMACRQSLYHFDPGKHRMYAWPAELRHCTGVAGEFFLLNRYRSNRDLAVRAAWLFLAPEIQSVLGVNGVGVPVLKSAAMDCLGKTPWRDDLFLSEATQICPNSAREHDFLHRLTSIADRLFEGRLDAMTISRLIEDEIQYARNRHRLRKAFMARHAVPVGNLAFEFG